MDFSSGPKCKEIAIIDVSDLKKKTFWVWPIFPPQNRILGSEWFGHSRSNLTNFRKQGCSPSSSSNRIAIAMNQVQHTKIQGASLFTSTQAPGNRFIFLALFQKTP